jgi:hypothetical protein
VRLRRRALVPLVLASFATGASAQTECDWAIEYGMNPSFHTWSSRAIVFADAMTRTRQFSYFEQGVRRADAPLIPNGALGAGWPDPAGLAPGQRYGAYLFGSMERTLPDGRVEPYVVTWRGSGSCELEGGAVAGERNRTAQRVEVVVDPTRGNADATLACTWTADDPADPVRDIRVWLPGMEATKALLWPPFLEKVRELNGGRGPHSWRVLDWNRINEYGHPADTGGFFFDLAGRITPASPSQGTRRGMCPEYQVAFCNAVGANLHFLVPHRTDDMSVADYMSFLTAQFLAIRDGSPAVPGINGDRPFAPLDPDLTVTVELSNEIWNSLFLVNGWMAAEAARNGVTFHEQVAREIELVFDLADQVFSGPHEPRLRKYVGGFLMGPSYLGLVLRNLRPGLEIDALGPAVYFGPRKVDSAAWLATGASPSAAELLASARARIPELRANLALHKQFADSWTNPDGSRPALELYEGGQNFKSATMPWARAAQEAQFLPEMFTAYVEELVPLLIDEGVDLVNWYSFMTDQDISGVDPYGIWNDMNQAITLPAVLPYRHEGAPKAAAICLGPPLAATCPEAQAIFRTAGANVPSYSIEAPVLGRELTVTVDLRTTGHASAFVLASSVLAQTPMANGQFLFIRPNSAALLTARNGPIASWVLDVPKNIALVGQSLFTQAIHFGGGRRDVAYSNAIELVFGR